MTAPASCPKCAAALAPGERYCAACGYQVQITAEDKKDIGARIGLKHEKQAHQQRIRSGRTTILVVSVLTLLGAIAIFLVGNEQIRKAQAEIQGARGNEMYDQDKLDGIEKSNRKAAATNNILAGVNVVLALCFFGMWIWAKQRPLPATLAALILYVTVIVASAAIEPMNLARGIIVKVIILLFLIKAVDSARKFQRIQEHGI